MYEVYLKNQKMVINKIIQLKIMDYQRIIILLKILFKFIINQLNQKQNQI